MLGRALSRQQEYLFFTLTARTNIICIQHPHLQGRILRLCVHDALLLSYNQNILRR